MNFLIYAAYFAPSVIAWYRHKQGHPIPGSLGPLILMNVFFGWTIVGWILPLVNALGYNPVPSIALAVAKVLPTQGVGPIAPGAASAASGSSSGARCSMCGGSGSMSCSSCSGRGSWYDQPTTATGVAQLQSCGACLSSGRLRCTYCGGSGVI